MAAEQATQALEPGTALTPTTALSGPAVERFRPSPSGWAARGVVLAGAAFVVLWLPQIVFDRGDFALLSQAVIFAIIGISLNVLLGYTGTISLGHQAFVGVGAFTSAYVVTEKGQPFLLGVAAAAAIGALQAMLLGGLSLRVTGLYFALVTLSYGLFAQDTLFNLESITGGGAGREAPLPTGVGNFVPYYYICLAFLAGVLWIDWRLMKTKGGRALLALRENPRVASSLGIDVNAYLVFGFAVAGAFAGVGGALYAHMNGLVDPTGFDLGLAITFVLMTVAGGLRNRTGIVIASAFTGMLDLLIRTVPGVEGALHDLDHWIPYTAIVVGAAITATGARNRRSVQTACGVVLAGLAVLILTPIEVPLLEPHLEQLPPLSAGLFRLIVLPLVVILALVASPGGGGLGQQLRPIQHWLKGARYDPSLRHEEEVLISDART